MGDNSFISLQGVFAQKSAAVCPLGTIMEWKRKKYVYAHAGGALAAGKLAIGAANVANHQNCSVAAAAIGATTVSVTVGATAVTADQYKDGTLHVNDGTSEGQYYDIASNTACDASGTTVVKLDETLRVALVASATSEVSLSYNPFYGATHSTTDENFPVGIPRIAVTSGYYFWAQRTGLAVCLMNGNIALGSTVIVGDTAAGAVSVIATSVDVDVPIVGTKAGVVGVTTEYGLIMLNLAV